MDKSNLVKSGYYQHFKGEDKKYFVFGVCTHCTTGEKTVVYISRYGEHQGKLAVRPLAMFLETVSAHKERPEYAGPRFILLQEEEFAFKYGIVGTAQNTETGELTIVFVNSQGPDAGKLFNEPLVDHGFPSSTGDDLRTVIDPDQYLIGK